MKRPVIRLEDLLPERRALAARLLKRGKKRTATELHQDRRATLDLLARLAESAAAIEQTLVDLATASEQNDQKVRTMSLTGTAVAVATLLVAVVTLIRT